MIVVIFGGIMMGFIVIALVSAFSEPPPKVGQDEVGGVLIQTEDFFTSVEMFIQRMGMVIESVSREADGLLFQAFDPTPVRGARVLVLARPDPPGTPISLEDVNRFADSLRGHEALKGVLITTAGFLPDAGSGETRYRLELIDGDGWQALCGEFGVNIPSAPTANRVD